MNRIILWETKWQHGMNNLEKQGWMNEWFGFGKIAFLETIIRKRIGTQPKKRNIAIKHNHIFQAAPGHTKFVANIQRQVSDTEAIYHYEKKKAKSMT